MYVWGGICHISGISDTLHNSDLNTMFLQHTHIHTSNNKIQVQVHTMSPHPDPMYREKEECHPLVVFTEITEVPLNVFVMKTNHLMDLLRNQKLL